MVNYDLVKEISSSKNYTQMVACGIIPISIVTKLQVYETYKIELKNNDKQTAIQFTADFYNFSVRQIYKCIEFMEH